MWRLNTDEKLLAAEELEERRVVFRLIINEGAGEISDDDNLLIMPL